LVLSEALRLRGTPKSERRLRPEGVRSCCTGAGVLDGVDVDCVLAVEFLRWRFFAAP